MKEILDNLKEVKLSTVVGAALMFLALYALSLVILILGT